jgi:hypothetical protein
MGFSLGWVAVRGVDPGVVRGILGLRATGITEDVPESDRVARQLPGGWYLVLQQRGEHLVGDALLQRLSSGGEAVGCFVEEHVMYSAAACWVDGRKAWSVTHDSDGGIAHLDIVGSAPAELDRLHTAAIELQGAEGSEDVDYVFDVPVNLAKAATGFRHDVDGDPGLLPFEVLAEEPGAARPWWRRLLRT